MKMDFYQWLTKVYYKLKNLNSMRQQTNNWEIIDNDGTIYGGTEEEMRNIWEHIQGINLKKSGPLEIKWNGDLKLIMIVDIYN